MAKEIRLSNGMAAIVDDDDYDFLMQWKWYFNGRYAMRCINGKTTGMHRLIAGTPAGVEVDHINGNKLDNRRANLRNCTRSENARNCSVRSDNTSGYKGVFWHKQHGKWSARIKLNGKRHHLGDFDTPTEAGAAYDKAAHEMHGEFARLNAQ
jgi:hypothetical protein